MPDRRLHDPDYLRQTQYHSDARLSTRIDLHDRYSVNPHRWHRWVFDQFSLPNNSVVLEIGSGTGALWQRNADRVPCDWRVILSDFSEGMVIGARRRLSPGASSPRAWQPSAYLVADATRLPLPDASVDAVVANHMLYHVDDPEKAIDEIARVLRPSGILFATTNGHRHVEEILDLATLSGMNCGRVSDADRFGFETGEKLLSSRFATVETLLHHNALRITDVEPVVGFVESTADPADLAPEAVYRLRQMVTRTMSFDGVLQVTTEAGLLRAYR